MAQSGEWNRKNATLSHVTAKTEYGVDEAFIVKGIRAGKLEFREGSVWGNPYFRVLRSQLESLITHEFGKKYLVRIRTESELRKTKREIATMKKKLSALQLRQAEMEKLLEE